MIQKTGTTLLIGISGLLVLYACNTSQNGLFGKKTPHEKYRSSLQNAGLDHTRLGQLWLAAAEKSLTTPVRVSIPYKETGYFEMQQPDAAGYILGARQGEELIIEVSSNPGHGLLLFVELWEAQLPDKLRLLSAADTAAHKIVYEIKKDGEYIIRLQPELLQAIAYTITISSSPSIAFPVNKQDNPRIISFWGANRDAGARSHEGIDIQAKKRTPAIAPTDGVISRVGENNLGGKVVFMRPRGKDYNLYYAHLDEQLVTSGQPVKKGDTLGLIGNTGNALTTVPHLHFGIYAGGGAVDPLPFIHAYRPKIKEVKADTSHITQYRRVRTTAFLLKEPADPTHTMPLAAGSILKVLAAAEDLYKVRLPDDRQGFIKSTLLTGQPLRSQRLSTSSALFDRPDSSAAIKTWIESPNTLSLLGSYDDYYFAEWNGYYGWIKK